MKDFLKSLFPLALQIHRKPILVASMGRSGSTLLFNSIIDACIRTNYKLIPYNLAYKIVHSSHGFDLKNTRFHNGMVYKTHGFPSQISHDYNNLNVIFIYGSCFEAVRSVLSCQKQYGDKWINNHLKHLSSPEDFNSILEKDVLQIEKQIKEWSNQSRFRTLYVRFDEIWNFKGEISDFLELNIKLPKQRSRSDKSFLSQYDNSKLVNTYGALENFIDSIPVFQILNK